MPLPSSIHFHVCAEDPTTIPDAVAGGRPKIYLTQRFKSSLRRRGCEGSIEIHMHPVTWIPQVILQAAQPLLLWKSSAWDSGSNLASTVPVGGRADFFSKIQRATQVDF